MAVDLDARGLAAAALIAAEHSFTPEKQQEIVEAVLAVVTPMVSAINALIPMQASADNQLADKSFVNSTVGTNTANYISNNGQPFESVAQLEAYTGIVTNNDYAFVTGTEEQGNVYYDRYKATVEDSVVSWAKEYRLNNSSFTAVQWAAIQSGITSGAVALIATALQPSDLTPYRAASAQDVIDALKQTQAIADVEGYFTSDTVEGALSEIGTELNGVNALLGSGVIS